MRKIIAISFLFVFTALQYGKIFSYLYCELRVELTPKSSVKCDCEKIISEHKEPASAPPSHSHALKDKLNEPFVSAIENTAVVIQLVNTSFFINRLVILQRGYENPPYHPPATIS